MRKEWSRLSGLYGIKQVRQTPIHKLRIFVVQGSVLGRRLFFSLDWFWKSHLSLTHIVWHLHFWLSSLIFKNIFLQGHRKFAKSNSAMLIRKKTFSLVVEWDNRLTKRLCLTVFCFIPYVISTLGWKFQHNMSWPPPSISDIYNGWFEHQL